MKDLKGQDALNFIKELERKENDAIIMFKNEKYVDIEVIEHHVSDETLKELHKNKQIYIMSFWNWGKYEYFIKTL